ncbi:MAG TPA: hypothetical protein VGF31_06845, partial [Myxococcaceae bacterium]
MAGSRTRPTLVAEAVVPSSFVWKSHEGWLVNVVGEGLRVLGRDLQLRARFPCHLEKAGYHAVSPDLRYAVLAEPTRIRLIDRDGRTRWEVPHEPWGEYGEGSCWITAAESCVWAAVPRAQGQDEWWVLELES